MKDVFAFGDAHSHHKSVLGLLKQEGLIDHTTRMQLDVLVASLGDLGNCVRASRDEDLKTLSLVGTYIDKLILGNHEAPYLGQEAFNGFFMFPEIKDVIRDLDKRGYIIPCLAAGDILLSHAGVAKGLGEELGTAQEASKAIYNAFLFSPRTPLLAQIGAQRGGWSKEGGILWSDWSEAKCQHFTQIVGHTVGSDIRYYTHGKSAKLGEAMSIHLTEESEHYYEPTYNIDIGCNSTGFYPSDAIAGVWIRDGGIEFVKYNG